MRIVQGYPPNYAELDAAFGVSRTPGVIFSWGQTIFIPHGPPELSREILAHEAVHGARQGNHEPGIQNWWRVYIRGSRLPAGRRIARPHRGIPRVLPLQRGP